MVAVIFLFCPFRSFKNVENTGFPNHSEALRVPPPAERKSRKSLKIKDFLKSKSSNGSRMVADLRICYFFYLI